MTLSPKKSLGQHFLHDENIARKIISYLDPGIPLVLEIGPGKGILSKYLLEDPRFDPRFIEVDRESVAYLKERYPAITDKLIQEDFLKFNLESIFVSRVSGHTEPGDRKAAPPLPFRGGAGRGVAIIGNFPYNISSRILFRVFENRRLVSGVIGMFQKEVAGRIASPPGTREYGILSVLLRAFYDIDYLFTVNETVFTPPPRVKSAVIRLRRNSAIYLDCDENLWLKIVKTAFNQRRKTLRNSLRPLGIAPPSGWSDPLFDRRPEQLSVAEFISLTGLFRAE
jgi:16S rRNA (adenine1518-N6/adenine1519-N6)-dimethyltransferase